MRTWIHCVVNLSEKNIIFCCSRLWSQTFFLIQIILIQSIYWAGIPIYVMGFHWQSIWEFQITHCRICPFLHIHGTQDNRVFTMYMNILTVHRIKGRLARRRDTWMSALSAYIWPHRAPPLITQSKTSSISLLPSFRL